MQSSRFSLPRHRAGWEIVERLTGNIRNPSYELLPFSHKVAQRASGDLVKWSIKGSCCGVIEREKGYGGVMWMSSSPGGREGRNLPLSRKEVSF